MSIQNLWNISINNFDFCFDAHLLSHTLIVEAVRYNIVEWYRITRSGSDEITDRIGALGQIKPFDPNLRTHDHTNFHDHTNLKITPNNDCAPLLMFQRKQQL